MERSLVFKCLPPQSLPPNWGGLCEIEPHVFEEQVPLMLPRNGMLLALWMVWIAAGVVRGAEPTSSQPQPDKPTQDSVVWKFDNLQKIGGHKLTVVGDPQVIQVQGAQAIEFDGEDDAIFFDVHPLAGWQDFTAEVVFRPDGDGPFAQRFFHMQQRESEDRLLFETRVRDGKWYLDTYIHSGPGNYTQMDQKFLHPADRWHHAALVVEGNQMRHYVNGKLEIKTDVKFQPFGPGQTSVGVRINKVHWFKGAVREARFTPRPLEPKDFLKP